MEKMRLNHTPVRTCISFGINDIVLDSFVLPEEIKRFDSVTIKKGTAKVTANATINETPLTFGIESRLQEQVYKNSNQSYQITLEQPMNEIVELDFDFNETNAYLVSSIDILAKEGAKGTVLLKYKSQENKELPLEHYHNSICRVTAKKNSDLKVILINLLSEKSRNFISLESKVEESANLDVITVDFGGKSSISNYYMNLSQDHANGSIESIFLGKESQKIDMNYIAQLRGKKSNANIDVQGALKDKASKSFKGTLDFKTGAKQAVGNENEFCLLLSDRARSKSLPMLLCSEEDVEGNHSSASGKVDAKELFYLMSRGFSQKDAMKLLVLSRFTHIIDRMELDELKEEVLAEIDKRLD